MFFIWRNRLSLVASIISLYSKEKYETFTIGFEDNEYDESIKAKKIANYLGLKNNKLILNEKIIGILSLN